MFCLHHDVTKALHKGPGLISLYLSSYASDSAMLYIIKVKSHVLCYNVTMVSTCWESYKNTASFVSSFSHFSYCR